MLHALPEWSTHSASDLPRHRDDDVRSQHGRPSPDDREEFPIIHCLQRSPEMKRDDLEPVVADWGGEAINWLLNVQWNDSSMVTPSRSKAASLPPNVSIPGSNIQGTAG